MTTTDKTKKQLIYEAASRLFRDKGYPATSMRDLARAVDLKASSLYNHIGSKEEILQDICFSNARRFLEGMEAVERSGDPPVEKIKALLALHVRIAGRDITSVTAFNDEWRHLSEPHLSEFKRLRRDYETRFKKILLKGMEAGTLRSMDPTVMLYTLLSSVRWLYDWYRRGGELSMEDLQDQITAMLMEGLIRRGG
ncbi:MAG: TetR/AcrR family transcriptional regulator [Saprospiraceae bacterium]|nr:TetR/AcrR family transcriptional regulator [Saprospiraceae bacterium]